MNYFILIIVALVGIVLGIYIARRRANDGLIAKQMEQKAENKQKILAFAQEHRTFRPGSRQEITNNDVEKLVGVSNATAQRYLDELEKEGYLTQHGAIGQSVFYTSK